MGDEKVEMNVWEMIKNRVKSSNASYKQDRNNDAQMVTFHVSIAD